MSEHCQNLRDDGGSSRPEKTGGGAHEPNNMVSKIGFDICIKKEFEAIGEGEGRPIPSRDRRRESLRQNTKNTAVPSNSCVTLPSNNDVHPLPKVIDRNT